MQRPQYRICLIRIILDPNLLNPLFYLFVHKARHGEACDVALYVSHKHRYAQTRKSLSQHYKRNGLACTGGSRDQTVPVCVFGGQVDRLAALANEYPIHENLIDNSNCGAVPS